MKLETTARDAIEVLKSCGPKGIEISKLAEILEKPRRRIYDVVAILRAVGLIATKRDKYSTKLFWQGPLAPDDLELNKHFSSKKLKVSTTGFITTVSNRGTEVVIESTNPWIFVDAVD